VGAAALAAAWISDDGMITLRTVENLVSGDGFRWNVAERTQTATHPLWILVLAVFRAATGELYATAIAVSLLCTTLAVFSIARGAAEPAVAIAVVAVGLLASRTGIQYASGGLENPLVFLLIAAFSGAWFSEQEAGRRLRRLGLWAALLLLARIDLALLLVPCVAAAMRGLRPARIAGALLPGAALLFAWCAFATLYFGSVIPTPGYAKALALDARPGALAAQGLRYLADLGWRDPASALLLLCAVALGLRSREARYAAPALGIALQTAYTLEIGGDFMAGRFFSAALFLAIAVLVRLLPTRGAVALGAGCALGAATAPGGLPWIRLLPPPAAARMNHGIVDERSYYARDLALWSPRRSWPEYGEFLAEVGAAERTRPLVGLTHTAGHFALRAGPLVHVVEPWICDPLLVRLPLADRERWRIGHFTRRLPEGYLETLAGAENRLHHPALREYYDALRAVVRDPALDRDRLRVLWRFLSGRYDHLLARYVREEYYEPPRIRVDAARFAERVPAGTFWFDRDSVVVREGGLRVEFGGATSGDALILGVDGAGAGELRFLRGEQVLARAPLEVAAFGAVDLRIPVPAAAAGFDAVEIDLVLRTDPTDTVLPVLAVLGVRLD
jgi:arabinofuranosyltransferase